MATVVAALVSCQIVGCGVEQRAASTTGQRHASVPSDVSSPSADRSAPPKTTSYTPPAARDWPVVEAPSCQALGGTITAPATLVRVPQVDGACLASVPLDRQVIFVATSEQIGLGAPVGTHRLENKVAQQFSPAASMSVAEIAVLKAEAPARLVAIVRGAESDGLTVEEILRSIV